MFHDKLGREIYVGNFVVIPCYDTSSNRMSLGIGEVLAVYPAGCDGSLAKIRVKTEGLYFLDGERIDEERSDDDYLSLFYPDEVVLAPVDE